ncbi:CidA/LrgA family protein [Acidocella sp.]|uniref:CidA/LrgA family protein n=1 Tax=Acidocella sp. TaxID=50710 RepID=UPI002601B88C|nr:CidA/LrgA family protein [Acidocella sp.]
MIRALAILLLCQLAGTILQTASGLPLPGPVIGLVLLLGALFLRGGPSVELRDTSAGLLKYLGVLFVPAGVGAVGELPTLKANWLALVVAIPVSTVLGLIVTGAAMQFFLRRQEAKARA